MAGDHKNWGWQSGLSESTNRIDGDVNRHCRLISQSECTTSDLMLFQYQLNNTDCYHKGFFLQLLHFVHTLVLFHFDVCTS